MSKEIHVLASLAFNSDVHVHGYMLTTKKGYSEAAELLSNYVMSETEKHLGVPRVPVLAVTLLDTEESVKTAREGVLLNGGEAKTALETATDFHVSIWMMKADDPLDKRLMEIH